MSNFGLKISGSLLVALLLTTTLTAKGDTTRVAIRDTHLGTSTEITDRSVLQHFNIWSGPGTYSGGQAGTQGFIIDWQAGVVDERPANLKQYELKFYAETRNSSADKLAYVVLYEVDPATHQGYVYLPGKSDEHFGLNVGSIHRGRGLEGHWFRATKAWQSVILPALARE